MSNNVNQKGYSRLHVEANEILDYYNNKQIWLGVILKKKDLKADNFIENYEPVKTIVMRTVIFDKLAIDEFDQTKHKYTYCCIFSYGSKKYIAPNSTPFAISPSNFSTEYVVVPYRMYYYEDLSQQVLQSCTASLDTISATKLSYLIDLEVSKKTEELVISEQKNKTRTQK